MSLIQKLISPRAARRHARPMLEILERRDCPTVQAFFSEGVLTVVGDAGNNVIDLFQPQDRVVQVVGDGQTWVFTDVDEVFVDAGDGDDQATSSKPKEIVVVGSKIKMEMGAGNDSVQIGDGGPLETEPNLLSTMNYRVDLGTGADDLKLKLENTGLLNLAVQSADGFDRHELGHALGFRHEHTRPESHVQMDLAGSGSHVDVDFDNIEQVDLSIVSQPVPGEPAAGGAVFVHWHVIGHGSTFIGRNDGHLQMISASSGGSASGVSTQPLATVSLSGGGSDPSTPVSVAITTGDTDDTLSILSDNVDLQLAVDLGAGDDLFRGDYSLANGAETIANVIGGDGRDTVAHAAQYTEEISPLDFAGAFHATTTAEVVDLELHNAPVGGDLDLHVHRAVPSESDASRASLHLAPGADVLHDDVLIVDVVGFEQVDLHLATAPNPDRPEKLDLNGVSFDAAGSAATSVHLADRDDGVRLEATSWSEVHLGYETLEPTIPTPDPGALVSVTMSSTTNQGELLGADTIVSLADGKNGLHVQAANFGETRLALEATEALPILPDNPEKIDLADLAYFPAAGSRGPGELVVPSLVQLDVHPTVLEATLLNEWSGPGSAEVTGHFPASASAEERPTFVSKLRVEDADLLAVSRQVVKVYQAPGDPSSSALDVDASLAAATAYEFENEAENIPAVRFAMNAPNHDGVVLLSASLPEGSSAGSNPVSSVRVTFSESLDAGVALLLDAATGDGADVVDASASGFDKVALNLHTGAGDDLVGWNFTNNDNNPAAPSIASHGRGVDMWTTIDTSGGNDAISFVNADASSIQLFLTSGEGDDTAIIDGTSNTVLVGELPPSRMIIDLGARNDKLDLHTADLGNLELDVTAGDGDDDVHTQVHTLFVREHNRLGTGDDRLRSEIEGGDVESFIDAGSGDDEVEVHAQAGTPAVLLHRFSGNMVVDLGEGINELLVETTDFAAVTQDFRSGNGNDRIEVRDRVGPFFEFKTTRLQQTIHTGGGDDVVIDDIQGREEVQAAIDTGSGNDHIISGFGNDLLEGSLAMSLSLGAGSDQAVLDLLGYGRIALAINTGPTGDGRDLIVGNISLSPTDRLRRFRRSLDGRQDLVELFVSAEYDVQVIGDETTLYVLIAAPPPKA